MLYRKIGVVFFPILLLGIVAVERVTTLLLGMYPSSPLFWAASIELRSASRVFSNWLDAVSGGIFAIQIAALAIVILLICILPIKNRFANTHFLINHLALLGFIAAAMTEGGGAVANAGPAELGSFSSIPFYSLHLGLAHIMTISAGLAGCACCHLLLVGRMRAKTAAIASAVTLLSLGLERRRPVGRNNV